MKIKTIISSGILAVLIAGCASEKGERDEQATLQAQAKLTKTEAQQIALAKVPGGTIKEGELEKENGKLIWSFDIATPGTKDITEVAVDALTGAVLSTQQESPGAEAAEKSSKN